MCHFPMLKSAMEPDTPSKIKIPITGFAQYHRTLKSCKSICMIVVCVLVLATVAYLAIFKAGNSLGLSEKPYFTVVVDCGSTGTRVNVYKWLVKGRTNRNLPELLHIYPDNMTKNTLWRKGCQYHCMQTEPGLDKFVNNASGVRASLEPLIHWAEEFIPSDRHKETPILVLATAGLRRLDVDDSRQVLEDVENVVKEGPFLWRKSWIRVLSGKEEAYYGWVSLNYRMGYLENSSRLGSLGLLDLGGSSLQVVVETNRSGNDGDLVRSTLGPNKHKLAAYSLPDFGLNEALDRTVAMLSRAQQSDNVDGRSQVRHPCLGSTYVQNYSCSNCLMINDKKLTSPTAGTGRKRSVFLDLVGDPDMEQCKRLAMAAAGNSSISDWPNLRGNSSCKRDIGLLGGSIVLNKNISSHHNERFHALSGFFVVYNMLNLTAKANLTTIQKKGEQLCSISWSDSSSMTAEKYRAGHYCFKVLYIASLLKDSLCLGDADIIYGPGDVSWTLGASLVEVEHLWSRISEASSGILTLKYMEVIPSPVLIFVLLLLLLLLIYVGQVKLPMPRKKGGGVGVSLPYLRQMA